MFSENTYRNATGLLASVSSIIKDSDAILALEVKMALKFKCPPPIGYNFELENKLENGCLRRKSVEQRPWAS
jgi:hypothetical protein